jgi:hypothetical protein
MRSRNSCGSLCGQIDKPFTLSINQCPAPEQRIIRVITQHYEQFPQFLGAGTTGFTRTIFPTFADTGSITALIRQELRTLGAANEFSRHPDGLS